MGLQKIGASDLTGHGAICDHRRLARLGQAIRDMPELKFSEEKLAQIAGAAMAAIEEAWHPKMGHTKRRA